MLRALPESGIRGALVRPHFRMDYILDLLDMPQANAHAIQAFSQGCGMKEAGTLAEHSASSCMRLHSSVKKLNASRRCSRHNAKCCGTDHLSPHQKDYVNSARLAPSTFTSRPLLPQLGDKQQAIYICTGRMFPLPRASIRHPWEIAVA